MDASQLAVGGTLTQLDDKGKDRVIAFYSKMLYPTEADYSANDHGLLGLISFLGRFRCYLEGSSFEIFTENQVLKHFFTKPKMSRKEARWLETLGNFGIFPITLKPGTIHVLGDTLSRAHHLISEWMFEGISCNDVEIPFIDIEEVLTSYEEDQFFGPVLKAMNFEWPDDETNRKQMDQILPMFKKDGSKLMYHGMLCVPRKYVSTILQIAHDSKVSGHFAFSKTSSRLGNYHLKQKSREFNNYVQGYMKCQQYKSPIRRS